ncbi:hypothetical protein CLOM_g8834 [Closterium sp. NIES-68]|nr:hypothetical protein CLOM_g8834 [Closterium sp. NIES-68]GJP84408.1 hypothetical protein CLOP_g14467 [Closterium sp. NIES-67]
MDSLRRVGVHRPQRRGRGAFQVRRITWKNGERRNWLSNHKQGGLSRYEVELVMRSYEASARATEGGTL